jgi:hypothetical protein
MVRKNLLLALTILLLSNCHKGLNPTIYVSDPPLSQLEGSDQQGKTDIIPYPKSDGMAGYSLHDFQSLSDYCAGRTTPGTEAPIFDSCVSSVESGGFVCTIQFCSLDGSGGVTCKAGSKYTITYGASSDYIALSDADNTALLATCDIGIGLR